MNAQISTDTRAPSTEEELEERLSRPSETLVADLARLPGDIAVLGVGGKMGPSLARLARRAATAADGRPDGRRILGVSRFSSSGLADDLHQHAIETVGCDLLDADAVDTLPDAANVVFMAGRKFGSSGGEALTWAMNALVPAHVARRYPRSRIVVFSSGNVYPFVPSTSVGATEETSPAPLGEYAQSVLARERIFEYFSQENGTPVTVLRLNYAVDLRYGVLVDVAQHVFDGRPIDVTMGHANVIWQGDANTVALRSLALAASPPALLNLTGPETFSIREVANRFGELFGKTPTFVGQEASNALLNDSGKCARLLGPPSVGLDLLIEWVAQWLGRGGTTLGKPTHFQEREGKF